jgi:hypothetical protein
MNAPLGLEKRLLMLIGMMARTVSSHHQTSAKPAMFPRMIRDRQRGQRLPTNLPSTPSLRPLQKFHKSQNSAGNRLANGRARESSTQTFYTVASPMVVKQSVNARKSRGLLT